MFVVLEEFYIVCTNSKIQHSSFLIFSVREEYEEFYTYIFGYLHELSAV